MFNFEKLDVWHKAIDFADSIYSVTRTYPGDERFGLTNQMRRAAVSISSNIAEGTSRASKNDFARFLEIATGSDFLSEENYRRIYSAAEEQSRMLSGLKNRCSQNNRPYAHPRLSTLN